MKPMNPGSKAHLRKTIRELREALLLELRENVQQQYLLQVPWEKKPRLTADRRERRRRLEAVLDGRAAEEGGSKEARERAFLGAVKDVGATFLNRVVLIRHLEALGLSKPAVVTGGLKSPGYIQFRELAKGLCEDDTQGYGVLLQFLFDELAAALPGLFGNVGLTALIPVPPATLRRVIEALDEIPADVWQDDMTLGWVYQYWNDPDREALDAKLHDRGKLEPHEIASKTQMFTERYMVEWLLQNSLGPTWLASCRKNGWTADAESQDVLTSLDERRAEWRKKREAGEVPLDALMPIHGELEEAWKYYVPQPLPDEVVKHAPASLRELKLLDPACGSGHFLVVAFDLLTTLYREEARHRGESWSDRQIAEWILENNLHGVDIDSRAVQIAAAAVFLKAKALARDAVPAQVNLVAPALRLSALKPDDPALLKLEKDIQGETGIPPELTRQLIEALSGVDHLGTLFKVGDAVDKAISAFEGVLSRPARQGELFEGAKASPTTLIAKADAKRIVIDRLNAFLAAHSGEEDLGLRLRGQQLTAGLRFAEIVREGEYHLVVGNPPYQGTSRMKDARYVAKHYPRGKSDLYAAFLERGLELCRPGGASAMVTMRGWMFLSTFTGLRKHILGTSHLALIGDLGWGAFEEMTDNPVVMSVCNRTAPESRSTALCPTSPTARVRTTSHYLQTIAGLRVQVGRYGFRSGGMFAVPGAPLIYWWSSDLIALYQSTPSLSSIASVRQGLATADNARFIRKPWEVHRSRLSINGRDAESETEWAPFIKGGAGRKWFEPLSDVIQWGRCGLEMRSFDSAVLRNPSYYFVKGIAFSPIGSEFSARLHRYPSIFGNMGSSVFPHDAAKLESLVCSMNSALARTVLESLNPGLHFEVGDVARLPAFDVPVFAFTVGQLETEFARYETTRETSIEFKQPGAHAWEEAQDWAQSAIDSVSGEKSQFTASRESPATSEQCLSFLLGNALGRFGRHGEGILDSTPDSALARGVFFISPRTRSESQPDVVLELRAEWEKRAKDFESESLEDWLRDEFFEYHRKLYENRPIYFPLASAKRAFVAYISIHRWTDSTLSSLLADHLIPERKAIEGALVDLQSERNSTDKKVRVNAEKLYTQHKKWLEELEAFIALVQEIAEKGPPPPDSKTEKRDVDAPYRMDLDDGVLVNSAALWPLLEPMWKDPKKRWKELANAQGRKDYDWSHLAARYFPDRVDDKCRKDPSLAVAHRCFWKYHPEKAYQWELRLKDEIGPDFKLEEKDSDVLRAAFLEAHPERARENEAAEVARLERKAKKRDQAELELDDASDGAEDDSVDADDETESA